MLGVKCEVGFGYVEGYKRSKYQSTTIPYLSHNGTTGLMTFFYLLSKTEAGFQQARREGKYLS